MWTRKIKISFVHIVQPMNDSMGDWLYFVWPIPVLCIVVLVLRSILSLFTMITTTFEATATAAAASFHCHGDESQWHRTPPKTIQLTWKQKGISNIKEEKHIIRYVGGVCIEISTDFIDFHHNLICALCYWSTWFCHLLAITMPFL